MHLFAPSTNRAWLRELQDIRLDGQMSCPSNLQDAPYLLEPLAASFANEDVPVRLALLSAVGKLFFQRPPECQRLLGTVLAAAAADSNLDVHDRALLYYRYL